MGRAAEMREAGALVGRLAGAGVALPGPSSRGCREGFGDAQGKGWEPRAACAQVLDAQEGPDTADSETAPR